MVSKRERAVQVHSEVERASGNPRQLGDSGKLSPYSQDVSVMRFSGRPIRIQESATKASRMSPTTASR